MEKHSSICKSIYFAILIMLVSVGCNTVLVAKVTSTPASIPTLEPLKLINGEIDACLLINSAEAETILGIKVVSKIMFPTAATGCKYISVTDDRVVLTIFVTTDATIRKANSSYSAVEAYQLRKIADLKGYEAENIGDIDNFGSQAYFRKGSFLVINVLKNKIFYDFSTRNIDSDGIGYDALMSLAKIALQRMP